MSPSLRRAAALLGALCALGAAGAAAQGGDTFVSPYTPALTPWEYGCSVLVSSSTAGDGMSAGLVTMGPCSYRQLHLHTAADEWLFVVAAAEPLVSVTTLPNNTAVRVALAPRDSVLYPRGYPHYQLNPSCTQPATYHTVFAVQNSGTINLVQNLGAVPAAYLASAFTAPPAGEGLWVLDAECERRCGR